MQMIRSKFSIEGRLKYVSHLDLLGIIERALRRAEIPLAFSQGFNPHPKIAFATAKNVGLESRGEYVDIGLDTFLHPEEFRVKINQNLPAGIHFQRAKEISGREASLMSQAQEGEYLVELNKKIEGSEDDLKKKIQDLLQKENCVVEKIKRKKFISVDIRSGIYDLFLASYTDKEIVISMRLMLSNQGSIKPELVLQALGISLSQVKNILRKDINFLENIL